MMKHNGIVLVEKHHSFSYTPWTDRFAWLFKSLKDNLGFEVIETTNEIKISPETTILLLYGWETSCSAEAIKILNNCSKEMKIICYTHDIHHMIKKCTYSTSELFERSDAILAPYYEFFINRWPKFANKAIFFPHFFAPHERYNSLLFNENPKMKCLLSGNLNARYSIRHYLKSQVMFDSSLCEIFDVLKHPRWNHQFHTRTDGGKGDAYANCLNEYFCCVTDSSKYKLVLTKYMEIPAAGSLLVADESDDLKRAGFVAGKHYVCITADNVLDKIKDILGCPEKYQSIRKEGMEFVRANHGVDTRINEIKEILK